MKNTSQTPATITATAVVFWKIHNIYTEKATKDRRWNAAPDAPYKPIVRQ